MTGLSFLVNSTAPVTTFSLMWGVAGVSDICDNCTLAVVAGPPASVSFAKTFAKRTPGFFARGAYIVAQGVDDLYSGGAP